ncbi:MAG: M56 family metallopeptidase [Huintestinicola sp.]|uniref:M56 family metallopeptidase n=1 Tax=Huintestinicola sp. TaxID=2981661 RepID=UPI003EFF1070
MESIFRTVLNMSITGTYIAAAIMLIRLFMKKLPKKYSYALWSILGIRLLCPFSFSSAASLFNLIRPETTESRMTYIPEDISHSPSPAVTISIPQVNEAINNSLPAPVPEYSADPMQIIMSVCSVIWLIGVGAMLIYTAVSFIRVNRLVRDSEHLRDNIYLCENIGSPFVFGYLRPRIYIPAGVSEKDTEYIAAHENTHIRRGDHFIKLLATAALSIHWFNPMIWLSYRLMSRDMELSCDERAVRSFEGDVRREYANALLNMSLRQNRLYGLLGFGETGIKSRIKGVLSLKKPTVIATISAVILLAIAAVCLLTNSENSGITLENNAGSYSVAVITYKDETETRLSDGEYIRELIDKINGAKLKKIRKSSLPDIDGGIYLDYAFRMYKSSDFTGEYDSLTVCRSGDVFYAVYESEGSTEYYKMSEEGYNELCGLLSDAPVNEELEQQLEQETERQRELELEQQLERETERQRELELEQQLEREIKRQRELELERELEFCLSYLTDYWNDFMKIGDFAPEKYISDPDMLMYANAKKKANEDTLGNGVKSLEAKSSIGKVLSGITDEGRIWLSFTYNIELNLEDGTTDNEHYNGYKAYFELEGSGDYMKVYRQYDMWGAWLEELGIEGTYDEPSDLQYVDIVKARESIKYPEYWRSHSEDYPIYHRVTGGYSPDPEDNRTVNVFLMIPAEWEMGHSTASLNGGKVFEIGVPYPVSEGIDPEDFKTDIAHGYEITVNEEKFGGEDDPFEYFISTSTPDKYSPDGSYDAYDYVVRSGDYYIFLSFISDAGTSGETIYKLLSSLTITENT